MQSHVMMHISLYDVTARLQRELRDAWPVGCLTTLLSQEIILKLCKRRFQFTNGEIPSITNTTLYTCHLPHPWTGSHLWSTSKILAQFVLNSYQTSCIVTITFSLAPSMYFFHEKRSGRQREKWNVCHTC